MCREFRQGTCSGSSAPAVAWYAKYRLPDGRQVQKRLGPAWTDRGRPTAGYFTKRLAEAWLRRTLGKARRGVLPGMAPTGATFADAAAQWLHYIEHDRRRKPSTMGGCTSIVNLPAARFRRDATRIDHVGGDRVLGQVVEQDGQYPPGRSC